MGLVKLGAQGQAPWLLGYKGSADANLNKEKSRDTMHDWKLSQKRGQGGGVEESRQHVSSLSQGK